MLNKVVTGLLFFVLTWLIAGCNQTTLPVAESEPLSSELEGAKEILSAAESWQNTYAEFLRKPENYAEDRHFAETFALADLDNSGVPELIIVYYNHIEGGSIFANIYLYDENISIIGRQVDMYYKECWLSTNPLFPGLFVEGGRSSTFSCNYWTIINNEFIDEPLWSYVYVPDVEDMEYRDLSGNEQLIAESKLFPSALPDSGTVKLYDTIKFFEINEANIIKAIYEGV